MTTTKRETRRYGRANRGTASHVLLHDDLGLLTLRRLRPWHRMLARCAAARLDRELAAGANPEASAELAARAAQLTSMKLRRDLAASLQRILAVVADPPADLPARAVAAHPPRIPLNRARIGPSGRRLAKLAHHLTEPGPVPVRGVAIVSQLLADGTGPLYHDAHGHDLDDIIALAEYALRTEPTLRHVI